MSPLPALLDTLRLAAIYLKHVDSADVRELGHALGDWLASGATGTVDQALRLRSVGGVSPARALILAERDAMLRDLHRRQWPELAPAATARVMALAFQRYEMDRWPRERNAVAAPVAEPSTTFWRLLRADLPMPGVDRLRQILT